MFPDALIWQLKFFPTSCIEIFTDNAETVEKDFSDIFDREWKKAFHYLEEDLGLTYEEDSDYFSGSPDEVYPALTKVENGKVTILLYPLLIQYCYGEFCDLQFSDEALQETLSELRGKYPEAEISGFIAFPWSDRRCGDTCIYPIGEEKDIYPRMADIINASLNGQDMFGNDLGDAWYFNDIIEGLTEDLSEAFYEGDFEMINFMEKYMPLLSDKAKTTLLKVVFDAAEDAGTCDAVAHLHK